MKTVRIAVASLALSLLGCGEPSSDTTEPEDGPPASLTEISLPGDALFPEGIAVDDEGGFYVGSLTDGSILHFVAGEQEPQVLVPSGDLQTRAIGSAVGMIVDGSEDLLWVCDGGGLMGERAPAVVGVDTADGAVVVRHPLPGGAGLCNDLAQDAAGNLYATDSYNPRVVRIAASDRRTEGSAVDWATREDWAVEPGQIGLNGLDVLGDSLYVVHTSNNAVYRIALQDEPGPAIPLTLDRVPNGLDGLKVAGDGSLVFVEGYADQITRIELLDGDRGRLSVLEDGLDGPTTFAFFADSAWIVEGQLPHLFDPMAGPPSLPFQVVRLPLDPELVP